MGETIDRRINNVENTLSLISAVPVVGTFAGLAKIALGAAQGTTALAVGALSLIPSALNGKLSPNAKYSWMHVKHGAANMIAGAFESIPVVQTILYFDRKLRTIPNSDIQAHIFTGHENKYMPYDSLVKKDWKFIGADDDEVKTVQNLFDQKVSKFGGNKDSWSLKKQLKFADEAIKHK